MIHEISPLKYNNEFRVQGIKDNSYAIIIKGQQILVKIDDDEVKLPEINSDCNSQSDYLFSINEKCFYSIDEKDAIVNDLLQNGFKFVTLKKIMHSSPKWIVFAAVTGHQFADWYKKNKFCGGCGTRTKKSDKERMLFCEKCGNIIYPKISPVAIVGIISGNKILFTMYADKTRSARYALVAGFSEVGEAIEDTVVREVHEETGLKVKNLHYYKSQPWSFSDSLLMGFFCEVDGSDEFTFPDNELSFAKWMSPEEIEDDKDDISLTYEMMSSFKTLGRKVLNN